MNMNRVAAFFCITIFAIGVCAAQNPGAQPNSGQMGTPSTQMPQTTTPSQTQPAEPPSQSAPQTSRTSSIDDQVKALSDQLNLSSDQQSKVRSILTDQHEQAMALIQDSSMDRDAKIEKIHNLRADTITKVRQTLTADQKPKFDAMVQQQDERMRERQEQGGSSPSSTSPSSTSPGTSSPNSTPPDNNPPSTPLATNPPTGAKPPQR
jgi:hypothetical protein